MVQQLKDLILAAEGPYVVLGLIVAVLILALFLLVQRRQVKKRSEKLAYTQRVFKLIQPEAGLENNLNLVLEVISSIVTAKAYAFYIRDAKSNYVLKAVRHERQEPGQVAPSYSGLAPYEKEQYIPPLSVNIDESVTDVSFMVEGEVPLFHLPLEGGEGLIRVGPIAKMKKGQQQLLVFTVSLLPQILDVLVESERLKIKAEVVGTSSTALQTVSSMAMDAETVVRKTFGMSAIALGMSGGCLLVSDGGYLSLSMFFGWSKDMERRLLEASTASVLVQLIGNSEMTVWSKQDHAFEQIVSLIGNRNDVLIIAGKLPFLGKNAWFVNGFPQSALTNLTPEQIKASFNMMIPELTQLIGLQNRIKSSGQTYAGFLKKLSSAIDNLNPYTVGYSDMMARYSVIIAKEMNLPLRQIRNIGLAAHLSNIGVLGLSEEIYLKEGKFTEVEFEKMKLHTDIGATIVEMTIGNQEVADCIRYHHERMDGNGYPSGLSGESIPIGARIIAVVQTFLAKINGRKYREPLPFDKAVQLLDSLSGAQLDASVVRAFTDWLETRRSSSSVKGRSLGPCWEMCCAPADVCKTCSNFGKPQNLCWTSEQNNCQAHGKSCESCFVYTEFKSRRGS